MGFARIMRGPASFRIGKTRCSGNYAHTAYSSLAGLFERKPVGKLQWTNIAYAASRDFTALVELSQKRVKHLLRYLRGTKHYKLTIGPTSTRRANTNNILDLDVHVDADWAGCPTTRKPTSGVNIIFLEQQLHVAEGHRQLYAEFMRNPRQKLHT